MSFTTSPDMVIPIPFWASGIKVATPVLDPGEFDDNVYPAGGLTVAVSCSEAGSHIFYTKNGSQPTHVGDTATGTTTRIGSNSGSINLAASLSGKHYTVVAIGYLPSKADSDPVTGEYFIYRENPL